jgi:hypothetical protein
MSSLGERMRARDFRALDSSLAADEVFLLDLEEALGRLRRTGGS